MGTLANFTGVLISPFLNYNTNIRNTQCKVQTCIKSSDMDVELETSSAERKYRINIVLILAAILSTATMLTCHTCEAFTSALDGSRRNAKAEIIRVFCWRQFCFWH